MKPKRLFFPKIEFISVTYICMILYNGLLLNIKLCILRNFNLNIFNLKKRLRFLYT